MKHKVYLETLSGVEGPFVPQVDTTLASYFDRVDVEALWVLVPGHREPARVTWKYAVTRPRMRAVSFGKRGVR